MADPSLARLSDVLFWAALGGYSVAMAVFFFGLAYRARLAGSIATALTALTAVAHATSIVARGIAAERVPWGNMYEYSSMVGLLIVAGYLIVVDRRWGLRAVGGFATGAAALALGAAALLYVPAGPLQAALRLSIWLKIHVFAAIAGSSLLGLSFIFTALYLLRERAERRARPVFADGTLGAARLGTPLEEAPTAAAADGRGFPADHLAAEPDPGAEPAGALSGAFAGILSRLPSAETFDRLAYNTVKFAFPIWTFAVIAGAIWAHEAWGRYWGWDPKETWAFITWVIYAGYLHARSTAGWRGRGAAVIASLGFASLLVTYYVVNLWIVGLHSYKNG